jgi:N-acetylmuramoyl-L-alanine amidase
MCQQGAKADALAGKNYVQILQHYYTGVTVGTGMPRAWGADRYETAIETAKLSFDPDDDDTWPGVKHVIIASGEDRAAADPLAAAGLVWAYDAPIFLIQSGKVPWQVARAISDIADANGPITVHVVGGTYSVPQARLTEIGNAVKPVGVTFDRVRSGGNRFDMAASIASRVNAEWQKRHGTSPSVVLAANGADATKFFDALALSPIAAKKGYPIILLEQDAVPSASLGVVRSIKPGQVVVGGGPATVSSGVVAQLSAVRWSGSDRYTCALDIANNAVKAGWLERKHVGVSAKLPDALVAGSVMGRMGGVSVITNGESLTPSVRNWLATHKGTIEKCYIFGGPVSVTGKTEGQIVSALSGGAVTSISSGVGRFPQDSVWYARVDGLPVHASSATWVDTIGRGDYVHPDFGSGTWAGGPIGIPFCPS